MTIPQLHDPQTFQIIGAAMEVHTAGGIGRDVPPVGRNMPICLFLWEKAEGTLEVVASMRSVECLTQTRPGTRLRSTEWFED